MTPLRLLGRTYHRAIDALAVLAAAGVVLILVAITGDVVSRQLGFGSFRATIPLVEITLLYFTVLGAPYLVREKGHVAVDSFVKMAPGAVRRAMPRIVLAVSVAACLVVAGVSAILLWETVESGELVIGGIVLPFWAYVAPLPLGYGLVATEFLRLAVIGQTPWADGIGESL